VYVKCWTSKADLRSDFVLWINGIVGTKEKQRKYIISDSSVSVSKNATLMTTTLPIIRMNEALIASRYSGVFHVSKLSSASSVCSLIDTTSLRKSLEIKDSDDYL
jgi:hypothetical protein